MDLTALLVVKQNRGLSAVGENPADNCFLDFMPLDDMLFDALPIRRSECDYFS